jgi:hypothetical protein
MNHVVGREGRSLGRQARPERAMAGPNLVKQLSRRKARLYEDVRQWIVFSDLHVHERYAPHWKDALQEIAGLLGLYNAGCIFLVCFFNASESHTLAIL